MTKIPGYKRIKTYISDIEYDENLIIPNGKSIEFKKENSNEINTTILGAGNDGLQMSNSNNTLSFNISSLKNNDIKMFENTKINPDLYSSGSGLPKGLTYIDGILKIGANETTGNCGLIVENLLKISNLTHYLPSGSSKNLILETYNAEFLEKQDESIVVIYDEAEDVYKDSFGVEYSFQSTSNTFTLKKFPENIEFYSSLHPYSKISFNETKYNLVGIENNAGLNCTTLSFIGLPGTIKYIGSNAFKNCSQLKDIDLSKIEDTLSIDENAFLGCENCTITVVSSLEPSIETRIQNGKIDSADVTIIPYHFIYVNEYGKDITTGVTYELDSTTRTCIAKSYDYDVEQDILWTKYTRVRCSKKEDENIYELIGITDGAFKSWTKLKISAIPYSVKSIGENAFKSCTRQYNEIDCTKLNGVTIGKDAFGWDTGYTLKFNSSEFTRQYTDLNRIDYNSTTGKYTLDGAIAISDDKNIILNADTIKYYKFDDDKKIAIINKKNIPNGYQVPEKVIDSKTNKVYTVIVQEKGFLW